MLCGVNGCRGLQLLDGGHVCKCGVKLGNLAQRSGGVAGSQLLQQRVQRLCGSPSHHTHTVGTEKIPAASILYEALRVLQEPCVQGVVDTPNGLPIDIIATS